MININSRTKLLLIVIVAIIGVYLGFEYILPLFVPFLLAYFIAWMLMPVVKFLTFRFHLPRMIGGILSMVLLGTGLLWLICYICNIVMEQLVIMLQNMPIYLVAISSRIDKFCHCCDKFFGSQVGSAREFIDGSIDNVLYNIKANIIPSITSQSVNIVIGIMGAFGILLIIIISILLIIKEQEEYQRLFKNLIFYPEIHLVTKKLSETGMAYLRAQGILMAITAVLCTAALFAINNPYAILIGLGIAVFDAFPVLGSGLVLVPWSLISLVNKDIYSAAVLMTLYLACQLIRQFLEPKLLGNRIGIKPVFTLMAMYVGIRVFGVIGFILGPLALVIIVTIIKETEIRLKIKGNNA